MWVTIPSPIMVVCRLFDPMDFLLLARIERELIDDLMRIARNRMPLSRPGNSFRRRRTRHATAYVTRGFRLAGSWI